ncbi:MAG: hypothetical protein LBV12_01265 [Puniceicoccales bacterium]|jgi:hypothetical protein|nr:hypothetical protein [Puniceicoccales bacterium]
MSKFRLASYVIALAWLYIGTAGQIQADSRSRPFVEKWHIFISENGDVSFQNEFLGIGETGGIERLEKKIIAAKSIRHPASSLPKIHVYAHEDATNGKIVLVLGTLSKFGFSENTFEVLDELGFLASLDLCDYLFEPAKYNRSAFEEKFSVESSHTRPVSKFKFTSPFSHAEANKKHR